MYEKLQQLLRAEEYEQAYAYFTPEYRNRYAPDLETFIRRAEADAGKIQSGSLVSAPRFAGNTARAIAEYGDEHVMVYFVYVLEDRRWLVTSEEHYRFLTEKGDRSTPQATLRSFLRMVIGGWPDRAYRMMASELGLTRPEFMRQIVPLFMYLFGPRKGNKGWYMEPGPRGESWAAYIVRYPGNPQASRPLCFVKKLDRWYIAVNPVGDAAAAGPFVLKFLKENAKRKKKNIGEKAARK